MLVLVAVAGLVLCLALAATITSPATLALVATAAVVFAWAAILGWLLTAVGVFMAPPDLPADPEDDNDASTPHQPPAD
jgi:hypothetical protein